MKILFALFFSMTLMASEPIPVSELPKEFDAVSYNDRVRVRSHIRQVERRLRQGDKLPLIRLALGQIIKIGNEELRKKGHLFQAHIIEQQWENHYQHVLLGADRDLGDFPPLWQWLDDVFMKLVDVLGPELVKALHLDDIWELNHALYVVIKPCDPRWDKEEYATHHFTPLVGVISYWTISISCSFAAPGLFFVCSPLGMLGEYLSERYIGPPVGRWVWGLACEDEL